MFLSILCRKNKFFNEKLDITALLEDREIYDKHIVSNTKELMETGRMFNIGKLLQYGFSKIVGVKPDDKSNISTKFNVSDPKAELVEGAENKINGQEISLEIFGLFKTLLEFSQGKSEDIWKFTSNFTPSISGVEDSDNMIEIIKAIMTGEQDSLTFKIQKLINIFMKHLKLDKEFNIGDFEGKGKTQFDADIEQEISKIEDEEGDEETEGVTSLVKEKVVLNKDDFRYGTKSKPFIKHYHIAIIAHCSDYALKYSS